MSSVDRFHSIGTLNRNSADATSQATVSEWKIYKLNGNGVYWRSTVYYLHRVFGLWVSDLVIYYCTGSQGQLHQYLVSM